MSSSASSSSSSSSTSCGNRSSSAVRWPCTACTFLNPHGTSFCEICGTRASPFSRLLFDEVSPALDPSVGSVFLPLQRCANKRPRLEHNHLLKILTYNVWFREDLQVRARMDAIGSLILKHSPDFICFQEVTPNIYEIFRSSKWWKDYICSVAQKAAAERAYFCMQMSRWPVEAFDYKPFPNSIMGRELCVAEMRLNSGQRLVIGTSHLESPCPAPPRFDQMYSAERIAQAKESLALLSSSQNAILAGDMNWDDKLDGAFPLPDGWADAWTAKKPAGESGWTYDTKSNRMLSANRTLQKRLDRFLCGLKDFRIDGVEMIGTEALPGVFYCKEKKVRNGTVKKIDLPVLPSDHYGLLLTLSTI